MEYENIEFYEALKLLGEKAGVELKSISYEDQRRFGVLYDINEVAKDFYIENLSTSETAKNYLKSRGLTGEIAKEFELGFAPEGFDKTTTHLIKKGYKMDDIVRAGVAFKSDAGRVGDRFRGRIMFPIHNHFGKIVGFTGRILPELDKGEMGKYINSPESPIFNKSKVLYGFWKSKRNIRDEKVVVFVEGQMDFLAMWSAGVKNTVATSGTALTPEHLKVLKPLTQKIILTFDNDEAGHLAAERALDMFGKNDFSTLLLDLGEHKDPADAVEVDPNLVVPKSENTKTAIQYYFDRYLGRTPNNEHLTLNKDSIRKVLAKIKNLFSYIEQSNWLKELSHLTGIPDKDLRNEMEMITTSSQEQAVSSQIETQKVELTRLERISLRLLQLLYTERTMREEVERVLHFMPANHRLVFKHIMTKSEENEIEDKIKNVLDLVSLHAEEEFNEDEFRRLLRELEIEHLKGQMESIKRHIELIEASGREEELVKKLKEFDEISRRMQDIKIAKPKDN